MLQKCSECGGDFLGSARNIAIEEICMLVGNRCPYSGNGCNFALTKTLLPLHASKCLYREVDCLLIKIPDQNCSWFGTLKVLQSHLKQYHANIISEKNYFTSSVSENDIKIIFHKSEIFIYYKYLRDNEWFAIVQRAGCSEETFKCVFRIWSSENKFESINMTFTVTSISKSIDDVFEEGRSLILHDNVTKNFVTGDNLSMMVVVEEAK
jgi:hypothetical protein